MKAKAAFPETEVALTFEKASPGNPGATSSSDRDALVSPHDAFTSTDVALIEVGATLVPEDDALAHPKVAATKPKDTF